MYIERFFIHKIDPKWVFFIIFSNLLLLVSCLKDDAISPVIFSFCLIILAIIILNGRDKDIDLFFIGFSVSLLYGLFLYYYYLQVNGAPFFNVPLSDDSSYERDGLEYARLLGVFEYFNISSTVVHSGHNSKGYVYIIGLIAKFSTFIGGYHTLLPRIFNAFIHGFCVVFLFRLMKIYDISLERSFQVAVIFAFFPHLIYLSGHIYRDTIICFAVVYCSYKALKPNTSLFDWVTVVGLILVVSQLRFFSMLMLIACVMTAVIFVKIKSRSVRRVMIISSAVMLVLVVTLISAVSGSFDGSIIQMLIDSQEHYTKLRTSTEYSTGLASTILQMDFLPFGVIVRPLYLAINPLPFLDLKLPIFINGLGTILQVLLFVFSFLFTLQNYQNRKFHPLFIMLWSLFLGISLTSFQLRHMVMFYPFLFLLGSKGYFSNIMNKRLILNIAFLTVVCGMFGIWLYVSIKWL
jgi:hypothetical protein